MGSEVVISEPYRAIHSVARSPAMVEDLLAMPTVAHQYQINQEEKNGGKHHTVILCPSQSKPEVMT